MRTYIYVFLNTLNILIHIPAHASNYLCLVQYQTEQGFLYRLNINIYCLLQIQINDKLYI